MKKKSSASAFVVESHKNSIKHFLFCFFFFVFQVISSFCFPLFFFLEFSRRSKTFGSRFAGHWKCIDDSTVLTAATSPYTLTQTGDHIIIVDSSNNKVFSALIFTKNACWFCFWFFNKILHLKKWISRTTVFKRKNNIAYEFREWLHRLHGPLFRNVDVSFVCVCVYIGRCFRCLSQNYARGIIVCCCC